jgi:hypothetical protein
MLSMIRFDVNHLFFVVNPRRDAQRMKGNPSICWERERDLLSETWEMNDYSIDVVYPVRHLMILVRDDLDYQMGYHSAVGIASFDLWILVMLYLEIR